MSWRVVSGRDREPEPIHQRRTNGNWACCSCNSREEVFVPVDSSLQSFVECEERFPVQHAPRLFSAQILSPYLIAGFITYLGLQRRIHQLQQSIDDLDHSNLCFV